jgi:hypothetical protein
MPFAATYFYEAGSTVLLNLKSKKRSKLEVEDDIEIKLGRHCTCNVALRCAHGTIVAVEMQYVLLIKSVALGVQHAMYMLPMVICGLPGSTIFFHIIS